MSSTVQNTSHAAVGQLAHTGGEKLAFAVGGVGGVGIAAALSAGLAQMEYEHEKHKLKDMYREELAAQLGKSENKVKTNDIDRLAKGDEKHGMQGNRTVREQLAKNKKIRNVNIGTIFAGTLTALGAVALAMDFGMFAGMGTVASYVGIAATSFLTYHVVKKPIDALAKKLFNTTKKTTHEHIEEIQQSY